MPAHYLAPIVSQLEVAPRHFRLTLRQKDIAHAAQPGQFLHVLPRGEYSRDPLLRRAFSLLKVADDTITILYRVEGRGTAALSRLVAGDTVDILGPLGEAFAPLTRASWLVGGGVGVPPLAMLASRRGEQSGHLRAFIGARSRDEVLCREEFEEQHIPVAVATDDGTLGHHGRVTELLETALREAAPDREELRIYACGPIPMLRAVARLAAEYSVPAQVSLEENMPCGIGVCNGCVVPVLHASSDYARFRRICVQGPVLWAHEVDWSHYESSC